MSTHIVLDHTAGELLVHTGVAGRSARLGHRLRLDAGRWRAVVEFDGDAPVAIRAVIAADSLDVTAGSGGLTPLSVPERAVARANAHRSLQVAKFSEITYDSTAITAVPAGYRVEGALTVHGVTRPQVLDLTVTRPDGAAPHSGAPATVTVRGEVVLRQTDFGITPFSLMMGTLKVADEVRVTVTATVPVPA